MLESINAYTCIFAFLNLLILYFVLKKLLFKPVTEFMEKRKKDIEDSIHASEQKEKEALEMKNQYEQQLKTAKADGQKIIEDMSAKADKIYQDKVDQASADAAQIISKAKEQAAFEHDLMMKESRSEIAALAIAAASKVMEENMDNEHDRELINKFLDKTGVA